MNVRDQNNNSFHFNIVIKLPNQLFCVYSFDLLKSFGTVPRPLCDTAKWENQFPISEHVEGGFKHVYPSNSVT